MEETRKKRRRRRSLEQRLSSFCAPYDEEDEGVRTAQMPFCCNAARRNEEERRREPRERWKERKKRGRTNEVYGCCEYDDGKRMEGRNGRRKEED
jgi:hypothetical protein